jgi:hypothetical protein
MVPLALLHLGYQTLELVIRQNLVLRFLAFSSGFDLFCEDGVSEISFCYALGYTPARAGHCSR